MKRSISIVLGALLLLFAVFQFNDPDPTLWILFYGAGSAICFGALLHPIKSLKWVSIAYVAICVFYAIFNWPEQWMGFTQTDTPNVNVERARESCGLLFAAFFVAIVRIVK